uniref:E3 ubiquitin-protein ligase listerin n=1 Tax=Trichuris muris TaxID=70415 RepID=A0A5S6QMQ7_TRIMR
MDDAKKASAVVEHSSQCSHDLRPEIICRESLFHLRLIKEALFIRNNNCLNRDKGVEVVVCARNATFYSDGSRCANMSNKRMPRTKGGVAPSKSSQAAKLLPSPGTFHTFSVFEEGGATESSTLAGVISLSDDIRSSFRKIGKKNDETRIKGIQEVMDCLREKTDEIESTWKVWRRMYSKLCMDECPLVRKLSHELTALFLNKLNCDRDPSSILSVAPYVLLGTCDSNSAAASCACAISKNFNFEDLSKFSTRCHDSAFEVSCSILKDFATSIASLSNTSKSPARTGVGVYLALCTLAKLLSSNQHIQAIRRSELLKQLFDMDAFWSQPTHLDENCALWLTMMRSANKVSPGLFSGRVNRIINVLKETSDSQNLSTFQESWRFIICLAQMEPEFWQLIDVSAELIPKAVSLLLECGPVRRGVELASEIPGLLASVASNQPEEKLPILYALIDALVQSISIRVPVKMYAHEALTCFFAMCECLKIAISGGSFVRIESWSEKYCEAIRMCILSSYIDSSDCGFLWSTAIDLLHYVAVEMDAEGNGEEEFTILKNHFAQLSESLLECTSVESLKLEGLVRGVAFSNDERVLIDEASRIYHSCLENGRELLICEALLSGQVDEDVCRLEPSDSFQSVAFQFCEKLLAFISDQLKSGSPDDGLGVALSVLFDAVARMESSEQRVQIFARLFEHNDYALYKSAAIINEEHPFGSRSTDLPIDMVSKKCLQALFVQTEEEIYTSCHVIAHLLGAWWMNLSYYSGFKIFIDAETCNPSTLLATSLFCRHCFECSECRELVSESEDLVSILSLINCRRSVRSHANVETELEAALIAGLRPVNFSVMCGMMPISIKKLCDMCTPDVSESLSRERIDVLWTSIRPLFLRAAQDASNESIVGIVSLCRALLPTSEKWSSLVATRAPDWKVMGGICNVIPMFYDQGCQFPERVSAEEKSLQCCELLNWSIFAIKIVVEALMAAQSIGDTSPMFEPLLKLILNDCNSSFCYALAFIEYVRQLQDSHYVITFQSGVSASLENACQAAEQVYDFGLSPSQWLQAFVRGVKSGVTSIELFGIRFWSSQIEQCERTKKAVSSNELVDGILREIKQEKCEKTKLQLYWALSPLGIRKSDVGTLGEKSGPSLEISLVSETLFFEESDGVHFLQQLVAKKEDFEKTFFEESNRDLSLKLSGINFFKRIVPYIYSLSSGLVDYIVCFSLKQMEDVKTWSNDEKLLFHLFSLRLCNEMTSFLLQQPPPGTRDPHVDELRAYDSTKSEWMEFFLPMCFKNELNSFYELASLENLSTAEFLILRELSVAVSFMDVDGIIASHLPELKSDTLDALGYPTHLQSLLLRFFPLLCKHHAFVQFAAYRVLGRCVDTFRKCEPASAEEDSVGQNELMIPVFFCDALSWFIESFETGFFIVKDVEFAHPELNSMELFGYLLTWKLLLTYVSCDKEKSETNPEFLHRQQQFCSVLRILFFLLFEWFEVKTITKQQRLFVESSDLEAAKNSSCLLYDSIYSEKFFKQTSSFNIKDSIDQTTVVTLAFNVLFRLFELYPISVKAWWNDQGYKTSSRQYKFITQYISPILIEKELKTLSDGIANYPNLKVSIHSAIREVIAAYVKEELRLELVIRIPEAYPLAIISAEVTKQVLGFKRDSWSMLMKNLLCLLRTRTNSLLNCILFWKINIDSYLEGVEACSICMMTVIGFNQEIPRKACRQCKHKFHSACLHKWFRTSGKTLCPMCRTDFAAR